MALPVMTPDQRAQALVKAAAVRTERAELKAALKLGTITFADAIADNSAAGMKVPALLQSLPGVGKVRADQIMQRLGIAGSRRVRGLGTRQRTALLAEFA